MSGQQGSQRESVRVSSPTSLRVTTAAPSHVIHCTFIMILCWGMSCRYTDYSSLGSCLIVWLLAFLAPLGLQRRSRIPRSQQLLFLSTLLMELMARATEVKSTWTWQKWHTNWRDFFSTKCYCCVDGAEWQDLKAWHNKSAARGRWWLLWHSLCLWR